MTAPAPASPEEAAPPPAESGDTAEGASELNGLAEALEPEAIAEALQPGQVRDYGVRLWEWTEANILTVEAGMQVWLTALALIAAILLARPLKKLSDRLFKPIDGHAFAPRARRVVDTLSRSLLMLAFFLIVQAGLAAADLPAYAPRIAVSLVLAWIAIRLVSHLIAEPFWARAVALLAFTLAALNIFGLLGPTADFLDARRLPLGENVSVLTLLIGLAVGVLLFWLAIWTSGIARARIDRLPSLTPSVRLLLAKLFQLILITVAFLVALSSIGINLTALTVFGGAVGLGIGFGLQKIFSNLVSGVILLLDRSIKPGDVIQVDQTYGYVKTLGLRYSSVVTRDNHEHLIPNEEFIINKVVNWSFSDRAVRLKKQVGVAYSSDVRLAQKLMLEAAASVERVLSHPKPVCQLNEFSDSAVTLEIRFWISDPQNGINNVTSDVLFAVWDSFHENGVEFPFPQRDLHVRASEALPVRMLSDAEWAEIQRKRAEADAARQADPDSGHDASAAADDSDAPGAPD